MATIMENISKPININPKSSTGQYILEKYGGKVKVKLKKDKIKCK